MKRRSAVKSPVPRPAAERVVGKQTEAGEEKEAQGVGG